MTNKGVEDLYMWLSTAWPLVVKPGVSEGWKRAKMRELFQTFKEYTDTEVSEAYQKWTEENEKFPTTHNIINEIKWARTKKAGHKVDPTKYYQMEIITDDGVEYVVQHNGKINFTWSEFLDIPRNKDHLDPEEWERRFRARRRQIIGGKR